MARYVCRRWLDQEWGLRGVCYPPPPAHFNTSSSCSSSCSSSSSSSSSRDKEGVGLGGYRDKESVGVGVYGDTEGVGVGGFVNYRDTCSFVTNTALGVNGMMGNQVFKSKPKTLNPKP